MNFEIFLRNFHEILPEFDRNVQEMTYVCYGPSFAGILRSRPIVRSGSLGRIFVLLNFLSPLHTWRRDCPYVGAEGAFFSMSKAFFKRPSDP